MNAAEWLDVAAQMCDLWPHQPLPPDTAKLWFPHLADLPADRVRFAVNRLATEQKFRPSLAELRETAEPQRRRDYADAFAELAAAVRNVGMYQLRPTFADAALDAVVVNRGWVALCRVDLNASTVRAQLRDEYHAAQSALSGERATARAEMIGGVKPQPSLPASGYKQRDVDQREPDGVLPPEENLRRVREMLQQLADTERVDPLAGRTYDREHMLAELRRRIEAERDA